MLTLANHVDTRCTEIEAKIEKQQNDVSKDKSDTALPPVKDRKLMCEVCYYFAITNILLLLLLMIISSTTRNA